MQYILTPVIVEISMRKFINAIYSKDWKRFVLNWKSFIFYRNILFFKIIDYCFFAI